VTLKILILGITKFVCTEVSEEGTVSVFRIFQTRDRKIKIIRLCLQIKLAQLAEYSFQLV